MAEYVDSNPGQDTFFDLADKFNTNADLLPESISQADGIVTITLAGGGTLVITLPPGVDKILTGLSTAIIGTGPYQIEYQPGTYNITGAEYEILSIGQINIPTADLTYDTIHTVVVTTSETILLLTGTPSANPIAPTIASNQLLVTYIYVPANDAPIIQGGNASLVAGVVDGDTVRWKAATGAWALNPRFRHNETDAIMSAVNSLTFKVTSVGVENFIRIDGAGIVIKRTNSGSTEHEIVMDDSGIVLNQTPLSDEKPLTSNMRGGIKMLDNVPVDTVNAIYNDGGSLWFNGQLLCTAPCSSAGKGTVIVANSSYAVNLNNDKIIICYNDGTGGTITLPVAPDDDSELWIISDGLPTPDLYNTIDANGNLIESGSELLLPTGRCAVKIAWNNVDNWVVTSIEARPLVQHYTASAHPSGVDVPNSFGEIYVFVHTDDTLDVNLPPTPYDGQKVIVSDASGNAGTNNITVSCLGIDINYTGGPFILNQYYQSVTFIYNETFGQWMVASAFREEVDDLDLMQTSIDNTDSPYALDTTLTRYLMVTTAGGAVTVNLPASPSDGVKVIITDVGGNAATNNITLNGSGHNIVGGATYLLNSNYQSIALKYVGSAWFSVAG